MSDRDDNAARLAAVRRLADAWNEIPDYTATEYDKGRVDQRHDMLGELLEVLDPPRPSLEGPTCPCGEREPCALTDTGYPWCVRCQEHHRHPETCNGVTPTGDYAESTPEP